PLLSMPSVHSVRHVRAPAGPSQTKPGWHVNTPLWNSAPSQLPPEATWPPVVSVNAPVVVPDQPSTETKYLPAARLVWGISGGSLHASEVVHDESNSVWTASNPVTLSVSTAMSGSSSS